MLSQLDTTLSRDRNLNFNISDASSMQILDNQGRQDAKRPVTKFSSSQKKKEEVARKKEYDNYHHTFTNGSHKRTDNYKATFQPPKEPVGATPAQADSSVTAATRTMKRTNSNETPGPGTRKLIRTPTQVRCKYYHHPSWSFKILDGAGSLLLLQVQSFCIGKCSQLSAAVGSWWAVQW